ncbi:uncharacterized protein LOC127833803 [Dreissena polymorpha]|uniref:uncharacterized protein LOC127833803 n=1 Tax=Dreissena polymorpha TaxID=45954 RepID=UPI00226569D8|nr:uncharacterized protein LOC127833803 [Dreissena polymorpha]
MEETFVWFQLTLLLSGIQIGWTKGSGGQCYSACQAHCSEAWSKLWTANHNRQYQDICRHFGDINTCTMQFQTQCRFSEGETTLYQTDIVQYYTGKPHNCPLIGGNMEYKGQYDTTPRSGACSTGILSPIQTLLLALVLEVFLAV